MADLQDLPDELLFPILLTLDIRSLELFCSTSKIYREEICQDQLLWKQLTLRDFSSLFSQEDLQKPRDDYKSYYYSLLDTALQANYIISDNSEKRKYQLPRIYYIVSGNPLVLEYKKEELWKGIWKQYDSTVFFEQFISFGTTPEAIDWGFKEASSRSETPLELNEGLIYTAIDLNNLASIKWLTDHGVSCTEGILRRAYDNKNLEIFKHFYDLGCYKNDSDLAH